MSDKYESYIKTLESKIELLQSKVAEQEEIIHKLQTDHQINTLLTEIDEQDEKKLFENAMASFNMISEKIKKRSSA